jgi:hypothetical protein
VEESVGNNDQARDVAAIGLGALAGVLGLAAVLGVVRPPGGILPDDLAIRAIGGVLAGVFALYVARPRGYGRRLATYGMAIALVGLAFFGGALALDALITEARAAQ